MSELILIRHGQATPFEKDTDQLTELGQAQARAIGEALDVQGIVPTYVVHGPLERQRLTAHHARDAVKRSCPVLEQDDRLAEYDGDGLVRTLAPLLAAQDAAFAGLVADFENQRYSPDRNRAFQLMLEALAQAWQKGQVQDDRVESWAAFKARVQEAMRAVLSLPSGSCVLAFTSGGVIGLVTALSLDAPDTSALKLNWRVKNGSFTRFTFGGGRVSLDSFNEVAHLPQDLQSWR